MAEQRRAINARDYRRDRLALADRFGLKLGFQYADQAAFLSIWCRPMRRISTSTGTKPTPSPSPINAADDQAGSLGIIRWNWLAVLVGTFKAPFRTRGRFC